MQLFKDNYHSLIKLISNRYKNKVDAEDVVQDTFLEYIERAPKKKDNPEGLIRTMAFNIANEHHRKNYYKRGALLRQVYLEDLYTDQEWDEILEAPAPEIEYEEQLQQLEKKIRCLPPKQRQAIKYRCEGLNFKQVAKITGKTSEAAHYNFNAAMERLRK